MLEIKSVSWKNFLSYGPTISTIDFENLGQCIITGEVVDEEIKESYGTENPISIKKSNGSGKTAAVSAMQWVLFGRTAHNPNPGDAVINYYTGKDCWGKVELKSGDYIIRTRNCNGQNELIYAHNGDESKFTSDTLSTTKAQQAQLARTFGLDWEAFCGSVFFNQYGRPWMEMADNSRKKAIERILRVDRYAYYTKASKTKCEHFEFEITKTRGKINNAQANIIRLQNDIVRYKEAVQNHTIRQKQRIIELHNQITQETTKRDSIELPDIAKLKAKWDVVNKVVAQISTYRDKSHTITHNISGVKGAIQSLESKIIAWDQKSGKMCTQCEQEVPSTHIASKIEPLQEKLETERIKLQNLQTEHTTISQTITAAETALAQKKPQLTVEAAKIIHNRWAQHDNEIKRLTKLIESVANEENPHTTNITEAEKAIIETQQRITELEQAITEYDYLNRHYDYVGKSYTDRKKIKSFVFREHIPFINSRLKHYLDVFGLDVRIELTDSLGVTSNMWNYDFESGGERKRTDVAFMLATFDFHELMFGRQCNVLVLDEVDGRLDEDGINALIQIIKYDLAPKVEAILIISHREHMHDVFSSQIVVRRENRFSTIHEILR